MLVSETVRSLVGVGFEDRVVVRKYQGPIREAEKVTVREVSDEMAGAAAAGLMKAGARDSWRFFLENTLSMCYDKLISPVYLN